MEVEAAGAEVRAGQAHIAQGRAVGAAADRGLDGFKARRADGLAGVLDQMEVGLNFLQHIIIAVLDVQLHRARTVAVIQAGGNMLHLGLAGGKLGSIVVAHDVAQVRGGHVTLHTRQVEEALTALGVLGAGEGGQRGVELHGHVLRIDHRVLGAAGVDAEAVHGHDGSGGIEVLIADLADVLTVNGIGVGRAEALDVKQARALADLLIGGEADAELAVGAIFGNDALQRGHDLGHTGLVVRAQQGRAVGGDESLALHLAQEREHLGVQHRAGGGQRDSLAVVVFVDLRPDVLTAGVVRRVHVGDKAQRCGALLPRGGGQRGVDIAVLVHMGIGQAQLLQLLNEDLRQVKLAQRAGVGAAVGVRGRVDLYIF